VIVKGLVRAAPGRKVTPEKEEPRERRPGSEPAGNPPGATK
jgi:hypothetical protein